MSNITAEIRALTLDLELRPRHLLLTRVRPTGEDDVIGHERERRVRIVLQELQAHGLTVHDVCTDWMLPPAPEPTFGLRETGT
jgi:hypothetical protein